MINSLISALSYLKANRMVIELLLISQLHHWFQRAYLKESLKRNGDGHVHDVTKFYMCTESQFYESTSQTSTLDQIIRSKGPFHHHTMRRLFHHGGRTGKRVRRELQVASLSTRNRENSSTFAHKFFCTFAFFVLPRWTWSYRPSTLLGSKVQVKQVKSS